MALSPPSALSDSDKLDALRRLDQFREWRSLDDKRFCLVCGRIINGRQIQVQGGTGGNGSQRLNCPSKRCNSIPMDWVLPTDEILARVEKLAAREREAEASSTVTHRNLRNEPGDSERNSIASRLRQFAFLFKRRF